jgi:hypothetical protein
VSGDVPQASPIRRRRFQGVNRSVFALFMPSTISWRRNERCESQAGKF